LPLKGGNGVHLEVLDYTQCELRALRVLIGQKLGFLS